MNQFNNQTHDRSISQTIPSLIQAAAADGPQREAISAPGSSPMTYQLLTETVRGVAAELRRRGINRNDRVAVVLPNGPAMATAFLATVAVSTSAPLNPNYGEEEFKFYLSDLGAKALLVLQGDDSAARTAAASLDIPVLEIVSESDTSAGQIRLSEQSEDSDESIDFAEPDDIALVLHTSGTTSRPKIVPLAHRNLYASAQNVARSLQLTDADRCLNIMPLFHIHGLVAPLLGTLASGGCFIGSPGLKPDLFFDWLSALVPTWYSAVPTMHQSILSASRSQKGIRESNRLRLIRSSSAALAPQTSEDLQGAFGVPVVEAYGMTEAAHQIACNPLTPGQQRLKSVGQAAGPEVAIMDLQGALLPTGETGEIVIKGPNLTSGYENNPEANESAFQNGWFRTGDQGFFDEDGFLFITGRLKEIINRGGEKISPREIDEVLMNVDGVKQAVAFAVAHSTLGEDVVAAVVLEPGAEVAEEELRDYAFKHLAEFKVPSRIIFVDAIPKGPTGKLQRIGLAEKLADDLNGGYAVPTNEYEEAIVGAYSEVLDREQVGIDDNFFSIGGDSLRATQIVTRIRDAYQVEIPVGSLFRKPTPRQLGVELCTAVLNSESGIIDELLAELESISDEEAERLLESGEKSE